MNRRVLVWAVLVLAVSVVSMAADAPPAGTIRWDSYNSQAPSPVTRGPAPAVYTLSVPLSYPDSIDVDEDGCFYAVCHLRQSITKFRPDGTFEKLWLEDTGHSCRGHRMDMTVLPGERIYLASDHWLPIVRRFGPDTEKIDNLEGIWPAECIAADTDGAYFLSGSSEMKAYSGAGKLQKTWETEPLCSMVVGPDGLIYAVKSNRTGIVVYSRTGAIDREISLENLPGMSRVGFMNIAMDRNGDIYLSDWYGFVRLDNSGRPIARWNPYRGPGDTRAPFQVTDVAVRNGVVFGIVNSQKSPPEFQAFTPDGQCIARYVCPKVTMEMPWSVAVQPNGAYAVEQAYTSWDQDRMILLDAGGKPSGAIQEIGEYPWVASIAGNPAGGYYISRQNKIQKVRADGTDPVTLLEKTGYFHQIKVDWATGNIYTVTQNNEILILSPNGTPIKTVKLNEEIGLTAEIFIAVDPRGFFYISDTPKHRVVKLDMNGNLVAEIGKEGSGLGELRRPKGLTVDPEGRLIVSDTRNHRIQVFSPTGQPLGTWGKLGRGDGELDRPHGVTLLPSKALYIADTHNDRIVMVPIDQFWQAVSKEIKPPTPYVPTPREVIPTPGDVTVEGIVTASPYDFTDCVYIQATDRSWGTRVTLPEGFQTLRGERIRVTGTLELKEHAAKHVIAKKAEYVASVQDMPGPLGMANLYVGDGYRMGDRPSDLSNLGLLIKSWGRALMVDPLNKRFVISDGSRLGNAPGLEVYGGQLKSPLTQWPKVGQYVMVTGISAVRPVGDGTFHPAIRLRAQEDLQVLVEN